jgi:hypothetical protein
MATCRWSCSMQHSACRAVSCHRPCGVGDRSESPVSGRCFRLAPFSPSSTRCHRCRVTQMARGFTIECDGSSDPSIPMRAFTAPSHCCTPAIACGGSCMAASDAADGCNLQWQERPCDFIPSESVRRREWPRGMRPRHFRCGRYQLIPSASRVHWKSTRAGPGRSRGRQPGRHSAARRAADADGDQPGSRRAKAATAGRAPGPAPRPSPQQPTLRMAAASPARQRPATGGWKSPQPPKRRWGAARSAPARKTGRSYSQRRLYQRCHRLHQGGHDRTSSCGCQCRSSHRL